MSIFRPIDRQTGIAHGAGGCGPAFPSSPAVIGLITPAGGWEEELGVSELNTPGSHIQKLGRLLGDLVGMNVELLSQLGQRLITFDTTWSRSLPRSWQVTKNAGLSSLVRN
jgi:hypothetical protein